MKMTWIYLPSKVMQFQDKRLCKKSSNSAPTAKSFPEVTPLCLNLADSNISLMAIIIKLLNWLETQQQLQKKNVTLIRQQIVLVKKSFTMWIRTWLERKTDGEYVVKSFMTNLWLNPDYFKFMTVVNDFNVKTRWFWPFLSLFLKECQLLFGFSK